MGELISVIIPVFNVEKYLDQCLESVKSQTYKNLEVILVYDESYDNTLELCRKWERIDKRFFLVISAERCGLGVARNLGLSRSKGKYIIYLDSDDWLEGHFIEKLYNEISKTGVDYVSSRGFYEVNGKEINNNHAVPAGCYRNKWKDLLLISDHVCVWKKIYRKKWLEGNNLVNPPLFYYEDWGLYPIIIRKAKEIRVIDEIGVYYRNSREGCLSNNFVSKGMLSAFGDALVYIFRHLSANDLQKIPDKILAYYCIRDYYSRLRYARKLRNLEALQILENIKNDILIKKFGEFDFERYYCIAFGGFSLRWEVQRAFFGSERLNKHYCFSSIISVMSKCCSIKIQHKNMFRSMQIKDDIDSTLLDEIKNLGNNGILFIDFLEERYDLMELYNHQYLTISDAFLEAGKEQFDFKKIIKWGSDEYMTLWKEVCFDFIIFLKKYIKENQIIYVANRMSLYYGNFDKRKKYKQWKYVAKVNKILSEMESFFLSNFQGITIVRPDMEVAFTDKDFRLGCDPQYMNNIYYSMVGSEIFSKIMEMNN